MDGRAGDVIKVRIPGEDFCSELVPIVTAKKWKVGEPLDLGVPEMISKMEAERIGNEHRWLKIINKNKKPSRWDQMRAKARSFKLWIARSIAGRDWPEEA